jgi:hypothetical protein
MHHVFHLLIHLEIRRRRPDSPRNRRASIGMDLELTQNDTSFVGSKRESCYRAVKLQMDVGLSRTFDYCYQGNRFPGHCRDG